MYMKCLMKMDYLYFHRKTHYALVIQVETDGQEMRKEISYT